MVASHFGLDEAAEVAPHYKISPGTDIPSYGTPPRASMSCTCCAGGGPLHLPQGGESQPVCPDRRLVIILMDGPKKQDRSLYDLYPAHPPGTWKPS